MMVLSVYPNESHAQNGHTPTCDNIFELGQLTQRSSTREVELTSTDRINDQPQIK